MSDRGIRCGESDAGRAMRRSGWHSAVSSTLVSRSRAMPVGGPHRENWPALQSPRFCAVGDARSRCASRSGAGVSRSRAMPVGGPHRENWALQSPRFFVVGDARSRCASRSGAGFRAPARCRSDRTGAPLFRGWRCAISLRVAQRCRVSRSRAMPVGDRRSAFSWLAMRDLVAQRCRVSRSRAMPVGDRRSAIRVPDRRSAFSWLAMRVVARSARVSRSRAMPVGDRRSFAVGDAPSGQLGSPGARGIRKKPS